MPGLNPYKWQLYSPLCWQTLGKIGGENRISRCFFSLFFFLFYPHFSLNQALRKVTPLVEKEHILKSQNFTGQESCSLLSSKEKPCHLQDLHMHTQEIRLYLKLISATINELFSSLQNLCTLLGLLTLAVSPIFQAIGIVSCISFSARIA